MNPLLLTDRGNDRDACASSAEFEVSRCSHLAFAGQSEVSANVFEDFEGKFKVEPL